MPLHCDVHGRLIQGPQPLGRHRRRSNSVRPLLVWLTADTLHVSQDSITGLLLAGIGHINEKHEKNFLIVDASEVHRSKFLTLRLKLVFRNTNIRD